MIALIRNELMKLFQRKSSWIYPIIVVLAVIVGGIIYNKVSGEPDPNWQAGMKAEIAELQQNAKTAEDEEKQFITDEIEQKQKYLDENVNPNSVSNWHFMNNVVFGVTTLVTLLAVIVCSASVSSEFADGTIKQLLIRPHQRWAILMSKYLSLIIYSLILVTTLITAGYLVGTIIFGNGDFTAKIFEMAIDGQKVAEVGPQFFLKIAYYLPSLLVITAIAFMLSTLFKSQALAVGIGIFVLFISSTLGGLIVLLAEKYEWAKYLIFPHLDLTIYALQDKILGDITLPISLVILAVYYAIFMILTFVFFQKRDISI
ncbi:ABC transporter permease [Neobacillus sp. MER 74]|uniref:ABC transporter permease n=1 Tax=Neobacillus sp. MER 74 TaxID=2939566 RepID=UPI00203FEF9A|nr:ABC transporter permease subunit [Neobacillus sp. MER 74]MCM3118426.1 ABC transporter permease [Neobacillus sp. MER 74]